MKVLGPTIDFSSWGSGKGTEYPKQIWLWRSAVTDFEVSSLTIELPQDWGSRDSWRAQTKPCVYQDPGERINDLIRDWARLACVCLRVSVRGVGGQWPTGAGRCQGPWLQQSWEAQLARLSPFEWDCSYCHYSYHSLASGQTTGREHSPTHQQKIGLKIYWAWPCPLEQDPVFPTASPSHQEASSSLLSSSIRGQTEWKPQSQQTNQTNHLDHSLAKLSEMMSHAV